MNRLTNQPPGSSELPYEKCLRHGPQVLTDSELLAALLRTGCRGEPVLALANRLLYGERPEAGLLSIHKYNFETLIRIKGIGKVKAVQLLCLSELTKRLSKAKAKEPLCFNSPVTIANYYMEEMRHQNQEHMKLLMLNTKAGLIKDKDISQGTVNASLISPRELFIEALQAEAVSVILLHNHPSGDPSPSPEDVNVTLRIKAAGDMLGIPLLDHIIIGNCRYKSFRQEKLL